MRNLLIETCHGHLIAVEVKSTRTITPKLWAGLTGFRDRFADRRITGVLLHAGTESAILHGWLHARFLDGSATPLRLWLLNYDRTEGLHFLASTLHTPVP